MYSTSYHQKTKPRAEGGLESSHVIPVLNLVVLFQLTDSWEKGTPRGRRLYLELEMQALSPHTTQINKFVHISGGFSYNMPVH